MFHRSPNQPANHRAAPSTHQATRHQPDALQVTDARLVKVSARSYRRTHTRRRMMTAGWRSLLGLATLLSLCVACQRTPSQSTDTASNKQANKQTNKQTTSASSDSAKNTLSINQSAYVPQSFQMPPVENPGYVGYQQCAECHAKRVEECLPTSHFQTCRLPTQARLPKAFSSPDIAQRTLKLPGASVDFEMSLRDGQPIQTAIDQRTGVRTDSTIDLVYGAKSTSDEVYLSWRADESMWELPVAWVWAHDAWGAAGFDRQGTNDFARELTLRCFECHNTWFEHVPGTLSSYKRNDSLLMGVTCERCHGPGKQHVDYHRLHPEDKKSKAIVYPGGLERERLIDVCTQCHSNSIRHRDAALSFKPGEKLDDYYRTVTPKHNEDDHVANQIPHLRASKCFQKSQMTCITCHDPHLTADAPHGMTFQDACVQCHERSTCKERPKLPTAVSDNCTGCHMRQYAKINVNFDLADDAYVPPLQRSQHRIAVDAVGTQEVLHRWYSSQPGEDDRRRADELKQHLLEHWLADGQQRAAEGRFTAATASMREAARIAPDDALVGERLTHYTSQQRAYDDLVSSAEHAKRSGRDREAIELFQQVLKIRPDNAQAVGRLGALYANLGDRAQAEKLLKQCSEMDPDEQYGLSLLAWLALNDQRFAEAAQYYAAADEREPFNSKLNYLWGLSLVRSGQLAAGIERLELALKSDPRNLDAMRELIAAYIRLPAPEPAVQWAQRAAELTEHKSLRDLMRLAECQVALGQKDKATVVVALAIDVAQQVAPTAVADIKLWSESWSGSSK
ncbi:MAG: tetratricopeptide repeat protein [Pirellulaceae bacterium]|nr:tetratricopeptide repeat protein [Pirellulaceae bacterium]